jgi:carbon monoxide dehydrogenase subunit G
VTPLEIRREKLVVVPSDVLWQMIEPAANLRAWLPTADRGEVVSSEPPRRMRVYAGSVTIEAELHDEGVGTRVTLTARHVPAGWWSSLMTPLVDAPRIRKALDQALARLAASGG